MKAQFGHFSFPFISQDLYLSLIDLQFNNTCLLIFICAYDMTYIIMSFVKPLFSDPLALVLFAPVFVDFCVNKLLPNFQVFLGRGLGHLSSSPRSPHTIKFTIAKLLGAYRRNITIILFNKHCAYKDLQTQTHRVTYKNLQTKTHRVA